MNTILMQLERSNEKNNCALINEYYDSIIWLCSYYIDFYRYYIHVEIISAEWVVNCRGGRSNVKCCECECALSILLLETTF